MHLRRNKMHHLHCSIPYWEGYLQRDSLWRCVEVFVYVRIRYSDTIQAVFLVTNRTEVISLSGLKISWKSVKTNTKNGDLKTWNQLLHASTINQWNHLFTSINVNIRVQIYSVSKDVSTLATFISEPRNYFALPMGKLKFSMSSSNGMFHRWKMCLFKSEEDSIQPLRTIKRNQ